MNDVWNEEEWDVKKWDEEECDEEECDEEEWDVEDYKTKLMIKSMIKLSNMPPATQKARSLKNFIIRLGTEEAFKAALNFVECKTEHHFLTFAGPCGTGKTHLALGIGWYWLRKVREQVIYWQVESLLDALRSGFNDANNKDCENYHVLMDRVKKIPLLILDDLGAENPTAWAKAVLDLIIDNRYLWERKTVFTTNLNPAQLEPRIASRLREGICVLLDCGDYRKIKGK